MRLGRTRLAIAALAIGGWSLTGSGQSQRPAPAGAPASLIAVKPEQPLRGGRFEASGAAEVTGAAGILFVDDDRTREVMWLPFDPAGRALAPTAIRWNARVTDPEGMTFDGRFHYVVGSQSKPSGTDGDGLVRFVFDAPALRIVQLETIKGLRAFLGAHVAQLAGVERQRGDESLNIEAIAWDPDGQRLLLGLRAPLVNGRALVVPLEMRDRNAPFTAANFRVPGGRALELPLGGAGIRSLEYLPASKDFRLIAASPVNAERLAFRMFAWDGHAASGPPMPVGIFPAGTKPEGLTRVHVNGLARTVVVYDGSGYILLD